MTPIHYVIDAYRRAYETANGKSLHHIWYHHGWIKIRTEPHGYIYKKRRRDVEAMTATLQSRKSEATELVD